MNRASWFLSFGMAIAVSFVLGVPSEAAAQCTQKRDGTAPPSHGINLIGISGQGSHGEVLQAMNAWGACGSSFIPEFTFGSGDRDIQLNFYGQSSVCGTHEFNSSGGVINIYQSANCDLLTTLIHELGHAVGLDHPTGGGCGGYVMNSPAGQSFSSVPGGDWGAECTFAGEVWEFPEGPPPPGTPLIFDLDGDGILTSDVYQDPVVFDINGDGVGEQTGWTRGGTRDALLFLDLNGNKIVDGGGELFGNATTLPSGETAVDGFEALAIYDRPEYGGNADGQITRKDRVWSKLGLWIDDNHDGVSTNHEAMSLGRAHIRAISLVSVPVYEYDDAGNLRLVTGLFWMKESGTLVAREVTDVVFLFIQ